MKVYFYVTGLYEDNEPQIMLDTDNNSIPEYWQLVHIEEVHFNIDKDELIRKGRIAEGLQYEIDARMDHVTDNEADHV